MLNAEVPPEDAENPQNQAPSLDDSSLNGNFCQLPEWPKDELPALSGEPSKKPTRRKSPDKRKASEDSLILIEGNLCTKKFWTCKKPNCSCTSKIHWAYFPA